MDETDVWTENSVEHTVYVSISLYLSIYVYIYIIYISLRKVNLVLEAFVPLK